MKIFPSYVSGDSDVVWRFIAGLRRAGAAVWDYTRPGEIPSGSQLPLHLQEQIESSEIFLAFITNNSLDKEKGKWTQLETKFATESTKSIRILPVVDSNVSELTGDYKPLNEIAWLVVSMNDRLNEDACIRHLCSDLSLDYVPAASHPRFLFTERFTAELEHVLHIEGCSISAAQRLELMDTIECCSLEVTKERPNWNIVLETALALDNKLRRERLGQWYLPLIIKGLAQLELGQIRSAEASFHEATRHPRCDEHAYGGLGFSYYRQGRYPEAICKLTDALRGCRNYAWELKFDLLVVLQRLGEPIDVEAALAGVDLSPLLVEDWVNVMNLRGMALYEKERYPEAYRVLSTIWSRTQAGRSVADDVTAIYFANTLQKLERSSEAINVLREAASRLQDGNLYHHLAGLLWNYGLEEESLKTYSVLQHPRFRRRRYAIGYARRLAAIKNFSAMHEVCHKVLNPAVYGLPQSAEDFWYCGFAQYLLGKIDLAEYDWDRGVEYSRTKYSELCRLDQNGVQPFPVHGLLRRPS